MSGVISSVVTNSSAMVALNSLNTINSQLQTVQTAVSTGYRVSSAVQDGAAYAVAQSVRSNVAGLTSANQALGGAQGLLTTATNGLNSVSNMMQNVQSTLVQLSSGSLSASQRQQYTTQYVSQMNTINADIKGSTYNGTNLIDGSITGSIGVSSNETGTQITLSGGGFNGATMFTAMSLGSAAVAGSPGTAATGLHALLTSTGGIGANDVITSTLAKNMISTAAYAGSGASTGLFTSWSNQIGTALNQLGNTTNLVSNQITFNNNKIDALNNGIGALVDANMAQESAKLQSLQIQQQLATSSLSIADQSPSLLVKLFP